MSPHDSSSDPHRHWWEIRRTGSTGWTISTTPSPAMSICEACPHCGDCDIAGEAAAFEKCRYVQEAIRARHKGMD